MKIINNKRIKFFVLAIFLTIVIALSVFTYQPSSAKADESVKIQPNIEQVQEPLADQKGLKISYRDILYDYYLDCKYYATERGYAFISFEEFCDTYYEYDILLTEYVTEIRSLIDSYEVQGIVDTPEFEIAPASSSSSGNWYQNTGTDFPSLFPPAYNSKFSLPSCVWVGDIIIDKGNSNGLMGGHVGIIEGWVYSNRYNCYFWRTIEATTPGGVCYGVLDDNRMVASKAELYYAPVSNQQKREGAVNFCRAQLGKSYFLNIFRRNTNLTSLNWYCSELVWAAYLYVGINIGIDSNGKFFRLFGIMPIDLKEAAMTRIYLGYI